MISTSSCRWRLQPAGGDEYPANVEHYHVFVSEGDDKRSQRRCNVEVNAIMPSIPQYMY
jgi:hypothetical protein